jgi:hypothetical protein
MAPSWLGTRYRTAGSEHREICRTSRAKALSAAGSSDYSSTKRSPSFTNANEAFGRATAAHDFSHQLRQLREQEPTMTTHTPTLAAFTLSASEGRTPKPRQLSSSAKIILALSGSCKPVTLMGTRSRCSKLSITDGARSFAKIAVKFRGTSGEISLSP